MKILLEFIKFYETVQYEINSDDQRSGRIEQFDKSLNSPERFF